MSENLDEKEFLGLLQPHSSDETRKARRNASTISFLVVSTWILGIRLNDIRVLGADISKTNEATALLISLALLLYWLAMFVTCWLHDREIERERHLQGQATADALLVRFDRLERQKESNKATGLIPSAYHEVTRAVDAYNRQLERVAKAKRYGAWIRLAEFYVPLGLSIVAAAVLAAGIWHAL